MQPTFFNLIQCYCTVSRPKLVKDLVLLHLFRNRRLLALCMPSCVVFWNPDGLTQFGTPFEIRTANNYSIRTKGGNVGGYTAGFSYVPELQLGEY